MTTFVSGVTGVLGAILSSAMVLPQAVRAVRRGTAGVSPHTYQLFATVGLVWMAYGILRELWLFAIGNAVLGASAVVVLLALRRDGTRFVDLVNIVVPLGVFSAAIGYWSELALGWLAGGIAISLRFPQLRAIRKTTDIYGVSVNTWVVALAANITWFIYAAVNEDFLLIVITTLNSATSLSLILAVMTHRARVSRLPAPGM